MTTEAPQQNRSVRHPSFEVKQPHSLSPRIRWLRDFYFRGVDRPWNNEFTCWTTGTPWDVVYDETTYHIVPETYAFFPAFTSSANGSMRGSNRYTRSRMHSGQCRR